MTHLMTTRFDPPVLQWRDDHDDAALVRLAAAGDVPAQERLWRSHVATVHRVCASQLGAHDAEDATAETFLAAFRTAGSFDPGRGSVQAWLLGIAVNQVRRRWRADRRVAAILDRVHTRGRGSSVTHDHADAVISRVDSGALRVALEQLTERDRLLLVTQASGDLTPEELGRVLGTSAGTAKVRLHRARARLATVLESFPAHTNG
ncbi:MAG: putative polymerase subfamily sigma factor [Thermoleophilia bacterium]|nr:putative polymerase subfamily sigma factor [Thermoleophilia bacterium]